MNQIKSDTIARTICLCLALINQVLAILGKEVLPFGEDEVYQICSLIVTVVVSTIAWWKNNSFTPEAINADDIMKENKAAKNSKR